jgi:hypothetical protein
MPKARKTKAATLAAEKPARKTSTPRGRRKAVPQPAVTVASLAEFLASYLYDGKTLNRDRLRELAEANACWDKKYADFPMGRYRMTVGNRLRAVLAKGAALVVPA